MPDDDRADEFNGWGAPPLAEEEPQTGSLYPIETDRLDEFPEELDLGKMLHEAVQRAFQVKSEIEADGAFGLFLNEARESAIDAAMELLAIDPMRRTEIARLQAQAAVYLHAIEFARTVIAIGAEQSSDKTETLSH